MKNNPQNLRGFLLAGLMLIASMASARIITGTVTDETGETIISASVVVQGTTIGTVTDFDGNYTLDVPDDAKLLEFSYIGLQSKTVEITGSVINVTLKENSEVLEEVVVTGYGTTKKRDLVTSVASVNADQLKDVPVSTAAEALQGKLAGVSVTTTEGSPDADVKIRVRGGMSLTQSSDPLYIVDGFPVSSISDIAPSDIASMDVLKDAAATAIYGAQGANGVIIITTKDNKEDGDKFKVHVDYTGYMGWKQMAKKYDMMSGEEFVRMQYEFAALNLGSAPMDAAKLGSNFHKYFDREYQKNSDNRQSLADIINYWNEQEVTDWQDVTFGRKGLNSNHNVVVSGGNKMVGFNLTYNRIDDQSIMYGSNYARNNASAKLKITPIKGLTIALTGRFNNTNVIGSGTNTAEDAGSKGESRIRNAVSYTPLPLKLSNEGDDDDESFGNIYDPITAINDNYKEKVDNKYNVGGYVEYKFLKHYKVRSEVGYEGRHVKQDRYYGVTSYYSRSGDGNANTGGEYGNLIYTDAKSSRLKNTNTFNMDFKFNDVHHLGVLLGEETIMNKTETDTYRGYGLDPAQYTWNTAFANKDKVMKTDHINYIAPSDNMLSFFGRVDYDYNGKYYVVGTMRADASTKFAKGHQWGFFPSLAASWRIIDEEWMAPAQEVMSNFKLRLSVGTAGNNNVDLGYLHFDYLSNSSSYMQGFPTTLKDGGSSLIAANPNLKWETTFDRNLGLDFGFFNERLSGTIDLYWKTTSDLILLYKLAAGGYNYQYRNIGSTDNKGIEFSLNGIILDKKSKSLSYQLSANANISLNKNTVVDLGGMDEYAVSAQCMSSYYAQGYEFNLHVGESIGNLYGYKTDGWYTVEDFASFEKVTGNWKTAAGEVISTPMGNAYPGMTKLVDTNNDGQLNSEDITKIGCTMPKFNGGFGLNFNIGGENWGKMDMSAQFNYSYGNQVLNMSGLDYSSIVGSTRMRNLTAAYGYAQRYTLFDQNGQFLHGHQYTGRTLDGDSYQEMAAKVSAANANAVVANPASENLVLTDNFVEDASFLRLSALTIGYSLADKWIKKAHMSKCRIFFTASNLFCLTNYSGSDPEVDTRSKINPLATGVDFSAFPKSRAFNFGLNLSF
ncbi:MAG: TonB-dependent receptor [Paludibacteraceae bacterium]|nr:TonB-dependent receptor [Paludibacteraceae bacterium]